MPEGTADRRLVEEALRDRTAELERMVDERSKLVAQALAAEDRERRRLAEAIHDNALQTLLAARQELRTAQRRGDAGEEVTRALDSIDVAVRQLRDTALEVHPLLLERKGLESALEAIAQGAASLAGFKCAVRVDKEASNHHDRLVLSIARELLLNAAKHSGADRVSVVVELEGDRITIQVTDDGQGIEPERAREAFEAGHLGLAALEERIRGAGGTFELRARPEGGTIATATIPRVSAG
jgi:two-component system, NarL family, sensor kinase